VNFIDKLLYRYLLTKGDALGRKAKKPAGVLGGIFAVTIIGFEPIWGRIPMD
jgi:hypothetical protein